SMGLVDVMDGSGNVTRWAAARDRGDPRLIRALDEAVATLLAARNALERFSKLPNASKNGVEARALLSQAVEGIETGVAGMAKAANDLPGSATDLKRGLTDASRTI